MNNAAAASNLSVTSVSLGAAIVMSNCDSEDQKLLYEAFKPVHLTILSFGENTGGLCIDNMYLLSIIIYLYIYLGYMLILLHIKMYLLQ